MNQMNQMGNNPGGFNNQMNMGGQQMGMGM